MVPFARGGLDQGTPARSYVCSVSARGEVFFEAARENLFAPFALPVPPGGCWPHYGTVK